MTKQISIKLFEEGEVVWVRWFDVKGVETGAAIEALAAATESVKDAFGEDSERGPLA